MASSSLNPWLATLLSHWLFSILLTNQIIGENCLHDIDTGDGSIHYKAHVQTVTRSWHKNQHLNIQHRRPTLNIIQAMSLGNTADYILESQCKHERTLLSNIQILENTKSCGKFLKMQQCGNIYLNINSFFNFKYFIMNTKLRSPVNVLHFLETGTFHSEWQVSKTGNKTTQNSFKKVSEYDRIHCI